MTPIKLKYLLSFGSNQGSRIKNILFAIDELRNLGEVSSISSLYKSKSWGYSGADYYNGCLWIETLFEPKRFLNEILSIENKIGRKRTIIGEYEDRPIDLDIIAYEEQIIQSKNLIIPHPRMSDRNFVLIPMLEITPHWTHPVLHKTITQLVQDCPDKELLEKVLSNSWFDTF